MLISDWSSDVCSSDLRICPNAGARHVLALHDGDRRRVLRRARAAANGDQGRVLGFHDGDAQISVAARARLADRPVSARVDFPAARGHDHSVLDGDPVVRRASCRERVWSYVEVLEYVEYLKKTQSHNTT